MATKKPAASKTKARTKKAIHSDELFQLYDEPAKRKTFYTQLERYLAAGGDPDAPHPGFYGNDPYRGSTLLENALSQTI